MTSGRSAARPVHWVAVEAFVGLRLPQMRSKLIDLGLLQADPLPGSVLTASPCRDVLMSAIGGPPAMAAAAAVVVVVVVVVCVWWSRSRRR